MVHILIIEDEDELREELSELFRSRHLEVTAVANVPDAIAWLRQCEHAIRMLSDLRLPGKSGLDLALMIKGDPDLLRLVERVVLMTGHADITDQVRSECERARVSLLQKPVRLPALMAELCGDLG